MEPDPENNLPSHEENNIVSTGKNPVDDIDDCEYIDDEHFNGTINSYSREKVSETYEKKAKKREADVQLNSNSSSFQSIPTYILERPSMCGTPERELFNECFHEHYNGTVDGSLREIFEEYQKRAKGKYIAIPGKTTLCRWYNLKKAKMKVDVQSNSTSLPLHEKPSECGKPERELFNECFHEHYNGTVNRSLREKIAEEYQKRAKGKNIATPAVITWYRWFSEEEAQIKVDLQSNSTSLPLHEKPSICGQPERELFDECFYEHYNGTIDRYCKKKVIESYEKRAKGNYIAIPKKSTWHRWYELKKAEMKVDAQSNSTSSPLQSISTNFAKRTSICWETGKKLFDECFYEHYNGTFDGYFKGLVIETYKKRAEEKYVAIPHEDTLCRWFQEIKEFEEETKPQ